MIFKRAKSSVQYSKGLPQAHCGICRHFRARGKRQYGSCELVRGPIEADMWCRLFARASHARAA